MKDSSKGTVPSYLATNSTLGGELAHMLKLSEMGIAAPMTDTEKAVNKTSRVKSAIHLFVKQMLVSGQITHTLNSVS